MRFTSFCMLLKGRRKMVGSDCVVRQQEFLDARPFPHAMLDGLFDADLLRRAAAEFDEPSADLWVRYDGPAEKLKRTFNRLDMMPLACRQIFDWLLSPEAVRMMEELSGLPDLEPDPSLYGGGLHVTEPGGFLGVHLDNERHPDTGLARRLNLIVYLTEGWRPEWGGELELHGAAADCEPKRIAPLFGRAVVFETSNRSYHGHPAPLRCPPGIVRKSIAVFYWSEPRRRAQFVGGR